MPETQKTATANTGNWQNGKDELKHDTRIEVSRRMARRGSEVLQNLHQVIPNSTSTEGVYVAKVGDDIYSVVKKFEFLQKLCGH